MTSARAAAPGGRTRADLAHQLFGGGLLAAGAVAFLLGGGQHPPTDESMGEVGSDAYFQSFAEHVVADPNWSTYHAAILLGPVLWALGSVAFGRLTSGRGGSAGFATTGVVGLALAGLAWAIVFVLDGFVAPTQAAGVVDSGFAANAMLAFQSNQEIVIRLGLVSWLLLAVGVLTMSVSLLSAGGLAPFARWVVGGAGLVVGGWPLFAWAVGEFLPGPFTSSLWVPTVIATSLWFIAAAAVVAWPSHLRVQR